MATRIYPQSVTNQNVPQDVYLIADISYASGEIHDTYFINKDGNIMMVSDWVGHKPEPVSMHRLTEITGDTEQMIEANWKSYFYWKEKGEI